MPRPQQNISISSARPVAACAEAPVFGCYFYWWRPPLTVRSAGDQLA